MLNFFYKKINIKNFFVSLLFIFAFIIILYITFIYSKRNVIEIDDAMAIFGETFASSLSNPDYKLNYNIFIEYLCEVYHGKYISNFLIKFLGFVVPSYFKIHPVVWIQTGGAVFKGIFFAILSFSVANCLFLNKKNNLLLIILTLFVYLFIQHSLIGYYQIELYSSFYSFTFTITFFAIFWKKYINLIHKGNLLKKDIILVCIYAFFNAIACEITVLTTIPALIFIFMSQKIFKYNNITLSVYTLITTLTGAAIYLLSPNFIQKVVEKEALNIDTALKLKSIFFANYINIMKTEYIYPTIIIILLSVLVYLFSDKKYKKIRVSIILSLLISLHIFYLSLLFAGNNYRNSTYANHIDLILQIKLLFICIFLFSLSFLYEKKRLFFICLSTISLYFLCSHIMLFNSFYNEYLCYGLNGIKTFIDKSVKNSEEYYQTRYLDERIYAWYKYKSLPPTLLSEENILHNFSKFRIYGNSLYVRQDTPEDIVYVDNIEEVYEQYLKNGGCEITQEDIEKADFQRLLDKNFVLKCR